MAMPQGMMDRNRGCEQRWIPAGKPMAPSNTPLGRNHEREPPVKAGDRVEGSRKYGVRYLRALGMKPISAPTIAIRAAKAQAVP